MTLPRQLLFELNLKPGDWIEVQTDGHGVATFWPWQNRELVSTRSPGVVPESPLAGKR